MTSSRPSGSLVYFGTVFIELLASAPIASANNSNDLAAIGKPDSQNALGYPTEAVKALLILTVPGVACDDTVGIEKRELSLAELHAVLPPILGVFGRIPVEVGCHYSSLAGLWAFRHTTIWLITKTSNVRAHRRIAAGARVAYASRVTDASCDRWSDLLCR
jgi:hypothetical protein